MADIWAYCRVSTRKEEQEDSLETQENRACAFAAQLKVDLRCFVEQASAKSLTGRPVLTAALAELEALPPRQRPRYLYVTALDRLARNMMDGMYVGRLLRDLKVGLYVHGRGEVRLDTFAERATFVGESMGGDAENEARSKRMRDSWERRRREGKPTSNKVPYGLRLRGERDVPVSESAEWVRKAFEWYAAGDGAYVIGKRMDGHAPPHTWVTSRVGEDGEPLTKTRAHTRWESLRVMKLLRQKRYRGTIVDLEMFDAVQRRIADTPKYGSRRKREYPLSGAMRCGGCGRHLHGRATGASATGRLADGTRKVYRREAIRYYSCAVCDYMLNARVLEEGFFKDVGQLVADETLLKTWVAAPRMKSGDAAAARKELKRLETETSEEIVMRQRDRLFDLALSASLDELEFKRQVNRIDDEISLKKQRLSELRQILQGDAELSRTYERARSLLANFRVLYDAASYERKRELTSALAEALGGLEVSPDGLHWKKSGLDRS